MIKAIQLLFFSFLLLACSTTRPKEINPGSYTSPTLEVHKISAHVYQHISFLETQSFGKVPCNGMVVVSGNEAVIFDTPAGDAASLELINWVEDKLRCKVKAIIPTHFHDDCLGGLNTFHERGIPSYAQQLTLELADKYSAPMPENSFDQIWELTIGGKKVLAEYFGEGHTRDNVIGYFPEEKIVFGGCLIKETGAGKGNLADANTLAWPQTVAKLKAKYPDAKLVIPGHGKPGGAELFDYTIKLFEKN